MAIIVFWECRLVANMYAPARLSLLRLIIDGDLGSERICRHELRLPKVERSSSTSTSLRYTDNDITMNDADNNCRRN